MVSSSERMEAHLARVPRLRGGGPVSYDYGRWVDGTQQTLVTLFGKGSSEVAGFLEIVGEGAEARGWGLPLAPANPWGMLARLGRAEAYLLALKAKLSE
jgi:hypothetical protein